MTVSTNNAVLNNTEMPPALKKHTQDGVLYQRRPEIEAWLCDWNQLSYEELIHNCSVKDKSDADNIPSEVLLHFLRRPNLEDNSQNFVKLFRLLFSRIELILQAAIPDSKYGAASDIRYEVLGQFSDLLADDRSESVTSLDYFEVNFNAALASLYKTALRKMGPKRSAKFDSLTNDDGEDIEVSSEIDGIVALWGNNLSKLDDPAFRLCFLRAIDELPDDQKRVIGLLFLENDKDMNIMTISRILNCDERTVRNRRDRALKTLKSKLQQEWEE